MAESPLFGVAADCVQVVDKQEQSTLHVSYTVEYDDTALMQGDIAVPDAKTHQFFAFRGALFAHDFGQELFPFAPPTAASTVLPSWITSADVKRAARATNTLDGTAFSEADIPEGAVLEPNAALNGRFERVTADDARVPITLTQSLAGVDWQVADVAPGLYTFAGYVFSPPYNGWSPRAQLIEVIDSEVAPAGPVANLERIEGGLFPYQGRRLRGCIAAPEGSQLNGWFELVDRPELGWIEWLPTTPATAATAGALDLCFRDPRPALSGSLRLRLDVTTPDGTTRSFYTPDTLTALPGSGSCTASDSVCCPAGTAVPPSACAAPGSSECADAGAGTDNGVDEPRAGAGDHVATPADRRDADPGPSGQDGGREEFAMPAERDAGCAVAQRPICGGTAGNGAWLAFWLAFAVARLTRARGHRKTADSAQRRAGCSGRGHADGVSRAVHAEGTGRD